MTGRPSDNTLWCIEEGCVRKKWFTLSFLLSITGYCRKEISFRRNGSRRPDWTGNACVTRRYFLRDSQTGYIYRSLSLSFWHQAHQEAKYVSKYKTINSWFFCTIANCINIISKVLHVIIHKLLSYYIIHDIKLLLNKDIYNNCIDLHS